MTSVMHAGKEGTNMPLIDLRLLGGHGHKVATIDESNQITIVAHFGDSLPLTPGESRQFQAFLATNEARLTAACGGMPLRERIRVWTPEDAKVAINESYHTTIWPVLQKHPGRASICGTLTKGPWPGFHYGGFSPDGTLFVLIPSSLHEARYRELLLAMCAARLPSDEEGPDLLALAASIDTEERLDDPADGRPSVLVAAAHAQTLDVSYWLELAGTTPVEQDALDARRRK
jgi:hypothetical protein